MALINSITCKNLILCHQIFLAKKNLCSLYGGIPTGTSTEQSRNRICTDFHFFLLSCSNFYPCSSRSAAIQWTFTNSPSFLFRCKSLLSSTKQAISACCIIKDTAMNACLTEPPECLSRLRRHSKLRANKAHVIFFSATFRCKNWENILFVYNLFFTLRDKQRHTYFERKIMKKLFPRLQQLYFSLLEITQTPDKYVLISLSWFH